MNVLSFVTLKIRATYNSIRFSQLIWIFYLIIICFDFLHPSYAVFIAAKLLFPSVHGF